MYELYDPCTIMFFFRNKHIMIDLGTGNNNKINWAFSDKQEFIDIVEVVYRGARKGRGLVVSPKGAPVSWAAGGVVQRCTALGKRFRGDHTSVQITQPSTATEAAVGLPRVRALPGCLLLSVPA